jgi:hypothetical protein
MRRPRPDVDAHAAERGRDPGARVPDQAAARRAQGPRAAACDLEACPADGAALAEPGARRTTARTRRSEEPTFSETSRERSRRFVPAEFDRGDESDPRAARPMLTPSGRPGMGMSF